MIAADGSVTRLASVVSDGRVSYTKCLVTTLLTEPVTTLELITEMR